MKYFKILIQTVGFNLLVLLFVLDIKKKSSENDQTSQLVIFRAFFVPPPSDPKSEKNPLNQLIK